MIVVDTNLVAYLLITITGEFTEVAERALLADRDWVAPSIFRIELLNVICTHCRHRRLSIEKGIEAYRRSESIVADLPMEVAPENVLRLSVASGASGYDCVFVAAAKANSLPLVTFDQQLRRRFPETAISVDDIEAWFKKRNENQG